MKVHHMCRSGVREEMRQVERRLDHHEGEKRLTLAFECRTCGEVIEISRPAARGENLGATPRD